MKDRIAIPKAGKWKHISFDFGSESSHYIIKYLWKQAENKVWDFHSVCDN